MKKRDKTEIKKDIVELKTLVAKKLNRLMDLEHELFLNNAIGFEEKEVDWGTKKQPKMVKLRYKKYIELFHDEDTGEAIEIDRFDIVSIDGHKSIGHNKLAVYTAENLNLM